MVLPFPPADDESVTTGGEARDGGAEDGGSAVILWYGNKNKTRTKDVDGRQSRLERRLLSREIGLERVWRDVVDFGDPKSSGIGDGWGHKRVSVARVSILDGRCADPDLRRSNDDWQE